MVADPIDDIGCADGVVDNTTNRFPHLRQVWPFPV